MYAPVTQGNNAPVPRHDLARVAVPASLQGDVPTDPKQPRYWNEKGPGENWTKSVGPISIPGTLFEGLQALAYDPRYEYEGKVPGVIREALEEFLFRYLPEDNSVRSKIIQLKEFRDAWVDDILATDIIDSINAIAKTFDRWVSIADVERLLTQFEKMIASLRVLESDWRVFAIETLRVHPAIRDAVKCVFENANIEERRRMERVHDILYAE